MNMKKYNIEKREFIEQNSKLNLVKVNTDIVLCLLIRDEKVIHEWSYNKSLDWESRMTNDCFFRLIQLNNK